MIRKRIISKSLALSLALAMAVTNMPADIIGSITGDKEISELSDVSAASSDYGLVDNIQDGTILHCFDWKYNDIKAELPNIAAAGFTSVQTSPAQRDDTFGVWYMLYQPQSFSVTTNALGSKAELQALCDEAEKYGIKVIVDVVANHTRGMEGENGPVDSNLKNSAFFRYNNLDSGSVNWQDRGQVWSCNIGMRDLVSENTDLQQIILNYT